MIRVNCHYNVGGFRLFKLFLHEEQPCVLSDAAEQSCDAPPTAMKYINVEGCKAVYQRLKDGQYVFIIRSIPSIHHDDAGRATECAAIFSGDLSDKSTMDNIVLAVLNDLAAFEDFFSTLFSFSENREVAYDSLALKAFIEDKQLAKMYEGKSTIKKVLSKNSGIILFVPKSNDWQNPAVQDKVQRMLHLPESDLKHAIILTQNEIRELTNQLTITTIEDVSDEGKDDMGEETGLVSGDDSGDVKQDPGRQHDTQNDGQGDVVITGGTEPKEKKKDLKFYLLGCYALLSAYIGAWQFVFKKHNGQVPKWEEAFIIAHIVIILLIIIIIIANLNCK